MSDFVECQNCGRRFFAEHIDCPYCRDEQDLEELIEQVEGRERPRSTMLSILFASFKVVLGGIALFSVLAIGRAQLNATRAILGLEATFALVTLVGVMQRRRWARLLAIAFILANAALGVLSLVQRGQATSLAWGPGPIALLVFLIPFLSNRSREYFVR